MRAAISIPPQRVDFRGRQFRVLDWVEMRFTCSTILCTAFIRLKNGLDKCQSKRPE